MISYLYTQGLPVAISSLSSLVPSIVLGLLLVFRTNTAYERFWEGRKLWGSLINITRNLARQIWVGIQEESATHHLDKIIQLRLLVAFAIATKLHLRQTPLNSELAAMLGPHKFQRLQSMNHPPLEIAFWLADYFHACTREGRLHPYQLNHMLSSVDEMVIALGGCERILKTPIPLAYSIHLKQLLFLYCLSLPFQIVGSLHWWTALIVGLISFAVFGIEEIGIEIENPFGEDPNDLPLDTICDTMRRNIEDLISLMPDSNFTHAHPSLEASSASRSNQ
jgi:putative membrane protein